jgi:hypothetical protein
MLKRCSVMVLVLWPCIVSAQPKPCDGRPIVTFDHKAKPDTMSASLKLGDNDKFLIRVINTLPEDFTYSVTGATAVPQAPDPGLVREVSTTYEECVTHSKQFGGYLNPSEEGPAEGWRRLAGLRPRVHVHGRFAVGRAQCEESVQRGAGVSKAEVAQDANPRPPAHLCDSVARARCSPEDRAGNPWALANQPHHGHVFHGPADRQPCRSGTDGCSVEGLKPLAVNWLSTRGRAEISRQELAIFLGKW